MTSLRPISRGMFILILFLFMQGCGSQSSQTVCNSNCGGTPGSEFLYGVPASSLLNTFVTTAINLTTGGFSSVSITTPPILSSNGIVVMDARFLYVSVGTQIFGYSINPATGGITPLSGSPVGLAAGRAPQGLAATPNSYLLYAADAAGGIDAFHVDSSTGVLSAISGSPFGSGKDYQVTVDSSGRFLYATDSVDGEILAFTIGSSGALTPISGSPFALPGQAASKPYGILDTGSFLYTALGSFNQIAAFSVNSTTGALLIWPGNTVTRHRRRWGL